MNNNPLNSAFPQAERDHNHRRIEGLSKREWFAGMALSGAMAMRHNIASEDQTPERVAKDCVIAADAVLQYLDTHA